MPVRIFLLGLQRQRRASLTRFPRRRARDEAAAQHTRLPRWRIIEHTGLSRRNALLAAHKFDFVRTIARAQPCGLRRAGGAHADENLQALADRAIEPALADPVDVAQRNAMHPKRFARSDHHPTRRSLEPDYIQRRSGRDAQALALSDGEMRDALVPADDAALEVDDVARLQRIRLQPAHDVGVASRRHKADVLAVLLVCNR